MKTVLLIAFTFASCCLLTDCVQAQIVTEWRPVAATTTYYAPAATTTHYAPTTTYYVPAPVATTAYYAAPTTTYYAPAAVTTAYYAAPAYVAPTYVRRPVFPFLGWRLRRAAWENRGPTVMPY